MGKTRRSFIMRPKLFECFPHTSAETGLTKELVLAKTATAGVLFFVSGEYYATLIGIDFAAPESEGRENLRS